VAVIIIPVIICSSTELAACGHDHHPIVDSTPSLRP
jgi:hypothetical protein